jgi:hypothetical protein
VLAADPDALPAQTPEWTDCIVGYGGFEDASRLYELPGGRRLVLPMLRRTGRPHLLASEASTPSGWNFGGVAAPGGVRTEDLVAVFDDLVDRRVLRTSVRPNPVTGERWAAAASGRPVGRTSALAHVLDLEGGFEHVWNTRFTGNVRKSVRKALRCGVSVERDVTGRLAPAFYDLYELSLARWGRQQHEPLALARWRGRRAYSLSRLQHMMKAMDGAVRLWVASVEGRPAASMLVLQAANANYTRGAMDKELAGPVRANALLHRLAIEEACEAGCRYYHMGESGSSDALARFKSQFGARAYPYAVYHVERLPFTALDRSLRAVVKRGIRFRD